MEIDEEQGTAIVWEDAIVSSVVLLATAMKAAYGPIIDELWAYESGLVAAEQELRRLEDDLEDERLNAQIARHQAQMLAFINGQLASTTDATIGGVVELRDCDRVEVSDSIDLVSFEMPRLSCADTITEHINSAIARPPVVGRTTRADEDMQTAVEEVISAFRDILYGNDEHGVVGIFQQYAYEPQSRIAVVPVIVISAILEEAVRSISRAVYPAAAALFETQSLFWGAMDDVYALESDLQDAKVQHELERVHDERVHDH
ncbi:hypothetical protein ATCC90586_010639 [Pythium insidiosum]|nr:hypothetical protein ATCC90586_010639 [Pythium insidiosum]